MCLGVLRLSGWVHFCGQVPTGGRDVYSRDCRDGFEGDADPRV